MVIYMIALYATLGLGAIILVIPLAIMLLSIYQGNVNRAIVSGSVLSFLIFPPLTLVLLAVGAIACLLIGRQDTARICISCFVVFLAITAVLVVLGVAILSGMEPSPEVTG